MNVSKKTFAIAAALFTCLSAATALAQEASLPGGATTLKEGYRDWTVSCAITTVNKVNRKVCALTQEQVDSQSKQRVVAIELQPNNDKLDMTLVLPFGLDLGKGVTLQVDEGQALPLLPFHTCVPGGCLATMTPDDKTTAQFQNGKNLNVNIVAVGGEKTKLAISLNGFADALARTIALSQ